MGLIRTAVPNFLGGVSQQPDSLRQPNQLELQENLWSSAVDGLINRHPTEYVAEIVSAAVADGDFPLVHVINRSTTERYVTLIRKGSIEVVDTITGLSVPVHDPVSPFTPDFSYLDEGVTANNVSSPETFTGSWSPATGVVITSVPGEANPFGETTPNPAVNYASTAPTIPQLNGPLLGFFVPQQSASIYIKRPTDGSTAATECEFGLLLSGSSFSVIRFDISAAGIVTVNTVDPFPVAGQTITGGVTLETDGWYRLHVAVASTNLASNKQVVLQHSRSNASVQRNLWIWGAHEVEDTLELLPYRSTGAGPFKALTVADTTFVVNTRRPVQLGAGVSPIDSNVAAGGDHALLFVKQRGIDPLRSRYQFKLVGGTLDEHEYSSAGQITQVNTGEDVADDFDTALNLIAGVTADRHKTSTVEITTTSPIERFDLSDSYGDSLTERIWKSVEKFSDLPVKGVPEGFRIKVKGNESGGEADDYYLTFSTGGTGGAAGTGTWSETLADGIATGLGAASMPHKLTRMVDDSAGTVTGTPSAVYFEWAPAVWNDRLVGDDVNNPAPSFVSTSSTNRFIEDVFFFEGRLGFLSDQNVIMSEVSQFFNFWRTTVQTLPDSEVIDVQVSHTKVSLLKDAQPTNEVLLLNSDFTQFVLRGAGGILAPATVSITPVSEVENDASVEMASVGQSTYLSGSNGSFANVTEIFPGASDQSRFDSDDVSSQVPRYIPGNILNIEASSSKNVNAVVAFADGDRTKLWVYKYFVQGNQRVQSSWSEYNFPATEKILGGGWIDSEFYMVIQRAHPSTGSATYVEKMSVAAGKVDTDSSYTTSLDQRVKDTDTGVSSVYSAPNDETTISLPYQIDTAGATPVVITREVLSTSTNGGDIRDVVSTNGFNIVVRGDLTTTPFWVGWAYLPRMQLSKPVLKNQTQSGSRARVVQARWQLLAFEVFFEDTAAFTATVTAGTRLPTSKSFAAPSIGGALTLIGSFVLEDGVLRVPVLTRSDELSLVIQNNGPLPMKLMGGEWEAQFRGRARSFGSV